MNGMPKKRFQPGEPKLAMKSISDIIAEENGKDEKTVKKAVKPATQTQAKKEEKKVEVKKAPVQNSTPLQNEAQSQPVQQPQFVQQPVASSPVPAPYKPANGSKSCETRDKYTATMETELRTRVKIASAKMRIQFSQFIELAVTEKLEREGF